MRFDGKLTKQALLLGASHHHIIDTLNGLNESASLAAAQRGMQREWLRQALTQCLRIEGLGLVAVANQRGHA